MADTDKSLYSLRYNQITSNLEAFGGGSPQWTNVTLNNVDPTQVPVTRLINTTAPLQGGGNLTADRTLSIPQATSSVDGYLFHTDWTTFNSKLTSILTSANIFVGNGSNVAVGVPLSGDAALSNAGLLTFNTVNGNVGTFMNAQITVNAKGLITAASSGAVGNLTDAGTDGIVVTGGIGAVLGTGTSLAQHVADTTHNGYLSSTDWNTFNSKQAAGNYITALTGDVTASGPGSVAATLATVNGAPGTTTISTITTNGKGLVTSNSSAATTGSGNVVLATSPTLVTPTIGTATFTSLISASSNPATVGTMRLANVTDTIAWRNFANSSNLALTVNAADQLQFNLKAIPLEAGSLTASRVVVSDASGTPQLDSSVTTTTELSYVSGVTSAIQTQLNGKQATGNYITALTGDATASGPGSAALTLATVNGASGTTTISTITTNAKGLVTANSSAGTTGTGNVVLATSPTLVTPVLGTPTSGTLTNCTGLPVSGIAASAWSTYTPTVTSQTGTLTTASASLRYQQIGKTVVFSVKVTITTAGTGNGDINVTLPVNTQDNLAAQQVSGFEGAVLGVSLRGLIAANSLGIRNYVNASVITNGAVCYLTGVYEAA